MSPFQCGPFCSIHRQSRSCSKGDRLLYLRKSLSILFQKQRPPTLASPVNVELEFNYWNKEDMHNCALNHRNVFISFEKRNEDFSIILPPLLNEQCNWDSIECIGNRDCTETFCRDRVLCAEQLAELGDRRGSTAVVRLGKTREYRTTSQVAARMCMDSDKRDLDSC